MTKAKENKEQKTKKVNKDARDTRVLFLVLGVVVLVLVGFFGIFFFGDSFNFVRGSDKVYLTIFLEDEEGEESANVYSLDLDLLEISSVFDEGYNTGASFSENTQQMVFVRSYDDGSSQILIYEENSGETTEVTSRKDAFLRNPRFSSDGENIAFWMVENETPYVYVTDLNGDVERLFEGVNPLFSPDSNSLIYLKNNGVHVFDLRNEDNRWVFQYDVEEEKYWEGLTLSLSSNNDLIVTDAASVKKYVLEFTNWRNFEFEKAIYLDEEFLEYPHTGSQFSPDSNSFVSLEVSPQEVEDEDESAYGHILIFRDKESWDIDEVYDFEDYFPTLEDSVMTDVWLTDWVIK